MSEKCFCHLNGYKVKDADAREQLSVHDVAIKGLSNGINELTEEISKIPTLYYHNLIVHTADGSNTMEFNVLSADAFSYSINENDIKKIARLKGYHFPVCAWYTLNSAKNTGVLLAKLEWVENQAKLILQGVAYDSSGNINRISDTIIIDGVNVKLSDTLRGL